MGKKAEKSIKLRLMFIFLVSILLVSLSACSYFDTKQDDLRVHFIDVGQGDAALIQTPARKNILIDAGDKQGGQKVNAYLKAHGVNKLDIVIATHPHADHIAGLVEIVQNYEIEKIYMPKVTHTSETFRELLEVIKKKGLKISVAKAGVELALDVDSRFIAPTQDVYENLNDYSAVLLLEYGDNSFLFTGDVEKISEDEIYNIYRNDLSALVLKVAHHGSNSSSSQEFLQAVNPSYAIISCGENNRYGHPHEEVISRLKEANIEIYRTDWHGDILFIVDTNKLTIKSSRSTDNEKDKLKNDSKPKGEIEVVNSTDYAMSYIANKNSKVFHLGTCRNLPADHNRLYFSSKQEALDEGYRECSNCKP